MRFYITKIFFITYFLLFLYGCSSAQSYKESSPKYTIDMMDNIYQKVKKYPSQPIYNLQLGFGGCAIEVRLNDVLEFDYVKYKGLSNLELPLNSDILHSGKQVMTIKIYSLDSNQNFKLRDNGKTWLEANIKVYDELSNGETTTLVHFKPTKNYNNSNKEMAVWGV